MRKILIAAMMASVLAGCASSGNQQLKNETEISVQSKLQEGKTTKNEVKSYFGSPDAVSYTDSGNEIWKYAFAKVKVNGNDVTLTVGKYNMKLPASKAKAVIDGGYDGKTVVMGIRPENVHDSQMFIETSKDSVVECKINVYELLGAEVYLYFDCEGFPMTARVDPRTTARSGDTVKFALDMEKVHLFDKETEITITN